MASHPLHPTLASQLGSHLLPHMLPPPSYLYILTSSSSHLLPPISHLLPLQIPQAHGTRCHWAGHCALPMAVGWGAVPHSVVTSVQGQIQHHF